MSKRKLSMDEKRVRMRELFAESVSVTPTTTARVLFLVHFFFRRTCIR